MKKLKDKRGIPKNRALADFDNEVELKAKDFAYSMTDHNIKEKNISGKKSLENELQNSGKITREALLKNGIKPEELKPQEDLKQVEKRRIQKVKIEGKNIKKIK